MHYNEAIMSVRDSVHDGLHSVHEGLDEFATGAGRVGRGALAGLIGGAIAAFVMNRYRAIESRPANVRAEDRAQRARGECVPEKVSKLSNGADPRVQVAERVSRRLFDHELTDLEKRAAVPAVHYGYAAAAGAVYGGLAELIPAVGSGFGVPYATLMWLGGDEIALPVMGLTKSPVETPPAEHASALATRFVYGITLDISRRILRRVL